MPLASLLTRSQVRLCRTGGLNERHHGHWSPQVGTSGHGATRTHIGDILARPRNTGNDDGDLKTTEGGTPAARGFAGLRCYTDLELKSPGWTLPSCKTCEALRNRERRIEEGVLSCMRSMRFLPKHYPNAKYSEIDLKKASL